MLSVTNHAVSYGSLSCVLQIIDQMWPYVGDYVVDYIKTSLEPSIKKSLPASLQSFKFVKMDLGDIVSQTERVTCYLSFVSKVSVHASPLIHSYTFDKIA